MDQLREMWHESEIVDETPVCLEDSNTWSIAAEVIVEEPTIGTKFFPAPLTLPGNDPDSWWNIPEKAREEQVLTVTSQPKPLCPLEERLELMGLSPWLWIPLTIWLLGPVIFYTFLHEKVLSGQSFFQFVFTCYFIINPLILIQLCSISFALFIGISIAFACLPIEYGVKKRVFLAVMLGIPIGLIILAGSVPPDPRE